MNFLELINARQSCRNFSQTSIRTLDAHQIIEAAQLAPSAGGLQSYWIVAVWDWKSKQLLADYAYGQEFIRAASLVLVFFAVPEYSEKKYGERGAKLYCIQDATIACTYAQLAAKDMNIDSCWVGAFDEKKVCDLLSPSNWIPVAILPLGYAMEMPLIRPRRYPRCLTHNPPAYIYPNC